MQLFDIKKFIMKCSMLNISYIQLFNISYCIYKKGFYSDKFFINSLIRFINGCTIILKL